MSELMIHGDKTTRVVVNEKDYNRELIDLIRQGEFACAADLIAGMAAHEVMRATLDILEYAGTVEAMRVMQVVGEMESEHAE